MNTVSSICSSYLRLTEDGGQSPKRLKNLLMAWDLEINHPGKSVSFEIVNKVRKTVQKIILIVERHSAHAKSQLFSC